MKNISFLIIILALIQANISISQTDINRGEVLKQINDARKKGGKCGKTKMPKVLRVSWNKKLEKAAQLQSDDMAKFNFMGHTTHDSITIVDRLEMVDYTWQAFGENVAYGQDDAQTVIEEWLTLSPGHCKNIMNPKYAEIGLAKKQDAWTLVLARPLQTSKNHIKEVLFEKQEMLRLVNKIRTEGCTCKGKYYPPVEMVVWIDELERTAQSHSDDMFKNDFFNHKGSDGLMVKDRINWRSFYSATIGENIAKGKQVNKKFLVLGLQVLLILL